MNEKVYHIDLMVPIKEPSVVTKKTNLLPLEPFSFDSKKRFLTCSFLEGKVYLDDHDQWYYATTTSTDSLSELKLSRHIHKPTYIGDDVHLFLIDHLKELQLEPRDSTFDKAYAHVSFYTPRIDHLQPNLISALAHVDGDDDPQIASHLHFLQNEYKGMKTYFISGWESHSFATVTENSFYFDKIHLPHVSRLYLLYFTYFIEHSTVPSKQMMPRLLENLWASTRSMNTNWNRELVLRRPIY